jgi:hypothetical protein
MNDTNNDSLSDEDRRNLRRYLAVVWRIYQRTQGTDTEMEADTFDVLPKRSYDPNTKVDSHQDK